MKLLYIQSYMCLGMLIMEDFNDEHKNLMCMPYGCSWKNAKCF